MTIQRSDFLLILGLAIVALISVIGITVIASLGRPAPEILGHCAIGAISALAALARSKPQEQQQQSDFESGLQRPNVPPKGEPL